MSSGAAALVFSLWPGLRPASLPDKLTARIDKLAVEPNVSFGEYLARVGALEDYRSLRSQVVNSIRFKVLRPDAPGARGPQVKTLQLLLTQQGVYDREPSGVYGPATVRAVKEFQQAAGQVVDGQVGPHTLQALVKANPTSFRRRGVVVYVEVKVEGFRVRQFGPLRANMYDASGARVRERGAAPLGALLRPVLPEDEAEAAVRLGAIPGSRATVRPGAPVDQRGKLLWLPAPKETGRFFVRVELYDRSGELIDFADTQTFRLPARS